MITNHGYCLFDVHCCAFADQCETTIYMYDNEIGKRSTYIYLNSLINVF